MSRINKRISKLHKAPQQPLSHAGATADSDRAKRPPLVQSTAPDSELNPGDRVEGLANFGKPTGEFGTVEQTNEDDALVKWDDDRRMRLRQPWLKKVTNKVHALAKPASA
jgi:transcription elongation factor